MEGIRYFSTYKAAKVLLRDQKGKVEARHELFYAVQCDAKESLAFHFVSSPSAALHRAPTGGIRWG